MSEVINVPDGWELKALKSVGSCKNGLTYSPDDIVESEGLLVLRSSNIKDSQIVFDDNVYVRKDKKVNYKVQENDILVCVRNGSKKLIGKNTLITKEAIGMAHGAFMTVFNSKINKYIFQLFQSDLFFKQVEKNLGATINSINNSDLILFEFPFPKEKKEQEKIAKILSTLDTAIESTQKLIDKEKNIKKGLMNDLLQNGIDKNGKIRTPQTHKYKDSKLGLIPEEWEISNISFLVKNLDSKRIPLKEGDRQEISGQYPYYGASGIIDWVDDFIFDGEYILLGEDGENVVSRVLPLAFKATGKIWVNNHAHVFQCKKDVSIDYVVNLLENTDYKSIINGSAQPKITQDGLNKLLFRIAPKNEQGEIAKILNTQDKKIEKEEENLAKLKELKKGLMNDLLSGKVRVKV